MLHKLDQPSIRGAVGDDTAQDIVVKAIERIAGVSLLIWQDQASSRPPAIRTQPARQRALCHAGSQAARSVRSAALGRQDTLNPVCIVPKINRSALQHQGTVKKH